MAREPSTDGSWRGSGSRSRERRRRPHHTVSSLGAVGPRAARRTRGAQYAHNAGRRASDQICVLAAPRPTREDQAAASPSTPPNRPRHRDDASMASGRTCSTTPLGRLCRLDLAPAQKSLPGRTHVVESRRRGNAQEISCFGFRLEFTHEGSSSARIIQSGGSRLPRALVGARHEDRVDRLDDAVVALNV